MQYNEDSIQSANYLRDAIPLMVKYSIQPNPVNFALWYAYVSKRSPSLNHELDQVVANQGTCPALTSSELFRRYIIDDEIKSADHARESLFNIICSLAQHTEQTLTGQQLFETQLLQGLETLQAAPAKADLDQITMQLLEQTKEAAQLAASFCSEIYQAKKEIEQLRCELHELSNEASMDPLTQLHNRSAFDKELERLIATSQQEKQPLSLLMIDIDHFKQCNDDYGHLVGDQLLRSFAKLLKASSGDTAFTARFGGEEFAVLLPGMTQAQAHQMAEKMRAAIQRMKIKQRNGDNIIRDITASFGVAELQSGERANDYIDRADKALYQAKEEGRNRVASAA